MKKLWGGRFTEPAAEEFIRFSESFWYDRKLALAEVRGSRAWARALLGCRVLDKSEATALQNALDQLEKELHATHLGPKPPFPVEDVHTFVFARLEQIAGAPAKKLQTGRSRNEQVSLDLRLYLLDQKPQLLTALAALIRELAGFAERYAEILIPGYTHLQRAQPVSLGHHALAYAEMFLRDGERLHDAYKRVDVLPLGSGALAGTPLPIDREALARELGFSRVSQNSLDAVSDRDFAAELAFAFALIAGHLSRLAEDWILYSSSEFGWLVMGDAFSTGSSLMPQKKNPDALELIRGKSGRQIANVTRLLVLLKGLPLAYNRDLQEDKEAIFDSLETTISSLRIAAGVVKTTTVNAARAAHAVSDPALLATDLADLLVDSGVAFHDAHEIVGKIVSAALEQNRDFRTFTPDELKQFGAPLDPETVASLSAPTSVARRKVVGGTAVDQVRQQAKRVKQLAGELIDMLHLPTSLNSSE